MAVNDCLVTQAKVFEVASEFSKILFILKATPMGQHLSIMKMYALPSLLVSLPLMFLSQPPPSLLD